MNVYRLTAWPDLRPPFDKTPYRRMLSDMSHRHVSLAQLVEASGLKRREVRQFLDMLCDRGLIGECKAETAASVFGLLRPAGSWLRRARPVALR